MLEYENRTPDVTLAKLKHHKRQAYGTQITNLNAREY